MQTGAPVIIIFLKLKLNNVNGCNDISFGDHSILEGDRIPPLKSHGQALEEELCFPGVLSDNRDAPINLLRHCYGCLMPCTIIIIVCLSPFTVSINIKNNNMQLMKTTSELWSRQMILGQIIIQQVDTVI